MIIKIRAVKPFEHTLLVQNFLFTQVLFIFTVDKVKTAINSAISWYQKWLMCAGRTILARDGCSNEDHIITVILSYFPI